MLKELSVSTQNNPRITVIVAVYNADATLQQCLESITQQIYKNVELIVIDGGSTDGTVAILNRNDALIDYWISEPDRGVYHAWNKALKKASGDWICFLGADDYFWNAEVLTTMVDQFSHLPPNVQLVYGKICLMTVDGTPIHSIGQAWNDVGGRLKKEMCIPHCGAMHRRNFFVEHGSFDETYRIAGDYELLLRGFIKNNAQAYFISTLIAVGMRVGGMSSKTENNLTVLREVRRAQKTHHKSLPSSVWVATMMRAYIRWFAVRVFGANLVNKLAYFALRFKS